jgi:twinkle protein
MDVREYLNRKGISFTEKKNYSGLQAVFPCPQCGDKSSFGINLETGAYQCFRQNKCGIKGNFTDFQSLFNDKPEHLDKYFIHKDKKYSAPQTKPSQPNDEIYNWFDKRKITKETVQHFRIGLSPDGRSIMFPFYKKGKLENIKYRSLKQKEFWTETNCRKVLWNQDNITGKILYITEGEADCMALFEYGIEGVSVPYGVEKSEDIEWIKHDWKFLEKFEEIFLIMDADSAGQSSIDYLVNRLGRWRCRNVKLPFKDVNECLMQNMPKDEFKRFIDLAEDFNLDELKSCDQFTDEIIAYKNDFNKLNGTTCSCKRLTEIIKGWRQDELSVWTGQNGSGKSTFLSQEIIHLLRQGKRCCIGSFETPPKKYLWWFTKQATKKKDISDFDVDFTMNEFAEKLFIIDITGEIKKEKLFEIIEFGYRKYGIQVFVIDSLMKIDLTPDDRKIYWEQKNLVNKLAAFVKEYKIHVHLVAHPRKAKSDDYESNKTDVSGTGDITNIADNVFLVYRYSEDQINSRKSAGKTTYNNFLEVKKNREHGTLGKIGFYFNKDFKTFETEPLPEVEPVKNFYEKEEPEEAVI